MPRDGSGVYHTPAGTDGVPGRTVESAKYNINVHDVETELNSKRPVGSGGTGASSAAEALVNLGAEQAYQVVTDYNSTVFNPGSFRSATTALNSPVAGHAFAGICYTNDAPPTPATAPAPNTNLVVEARDTTSTDEPGILYVRHKRSGVWGPWTKDGPPTGDFIVNTGDTMTGDLIISKEDPTLILNKPASGTSNTILGQTNGKTRWTMKLGDESPETSRRRQQFCSLWPRPGRHGATGHEAAHGTRDRLHDAERHVPLVLDAEPDGTRRRQRHSRQLPRRGALADQPRQPGGRDRHRFRQRFRYSSVQ
jgi:hypothetical protein